MRNGPAYSEEDYAALVRMANSGVPAVQIARALNRSSASIRVKINRLRHRGEIMPFPSGPAKIGRPAKVEVPSWVPASLAGTYLLIARHRGEHDAAAECRRIKREREMQR